MDAWKPDQYEKFKDERSRPFFDLLEMIEKTPHPRVCDLGCGTGELTRALHERTGAVETVGIDNSAAMLEAAEKNSATGLVFRNQSIEAFAAGGESFDVLFSNAALQWVPSHRELLARLAAHLKPGGQLAVQIPANHDHPSHLVAAEIAGESPFREALGGYKRSAPILKVEEYAEILHALGFTRQSAVLRVYPHVLKAREQVVEWVKGTLLTDYEKRMTPEVFERFLAAYRKKLLQRLEDQAPYFYPFKRILFWGRLA